MPEKYTLAPGPKWQAVKAGCLTGYGPSPEDAYKDAQRKAKLRGGHQRLAVRRKEGLDAQHAAQIAAREQRINHLQGIIRRLTMSDTENWLLMAMAYHKTADPSAALKKMGAIGCSIGGDELAAITRVTDLMQRWTAALDRRRADT